MNLNHQKILSLILLLVFTACTSNSGPSANTKSPAPSLETPQAPKETSETEISESIHSSWKEFLHQLHRRSEFTKTLVNYVKTQSTKAELNSLLSELLDANKEVAAFRGEPEDFKNPETYARLHQAEKRLAAAFSKLPVADELYEIESSREDDSGMRIVLNAIEDRIDAERFRLTKLMMKNDLCFITTWDASSPYPFCAGVKADLAKGGCPANYQTIVLGDVCR